MFLILSLLLAATPATPSGDTAPADSWETLKKAAAHLAVGQENTALKILKPSLAKKSSHRGSALALLSGHYLCNGKLTDAKASLGTLKHSQKVILRIIASKTGSFPFLTPPPLTTAQQRIGGLYDTLNLQLCHHLGKLMLADLLYPIVAQPAAVKKLEEWAIAYLRIAPTTDYKLFGSFIAFRILAQKKMDQLFAKGTLTLEESTAFDGYLKSKTFTSPFPDAYPWRISALLPLTGKYRSLGKQMLLALMAARSNWPAMELLVHDTQSSPTQSLKLFRETVETTDKPIAVLLPPDAPSATALLGIKSSIPFLSVGTPLPLTHFQGSVYFGQLTREQITSSLVQTGLALGITRFAVIYPDKSYGTSHAAFFVKEVEKHKASVVAKLSYRFDKMPKRFNVKGAQAVFIPDAASRVE
ncbi:ABC transporter substrate-binding protein, partial [Myxococcota bacterium]|nr:ABC transporter substrate-binding protein [Myxococcota bacterium]